MSTVYLFYPQGLFINCMYSFRRLIHNPRSNYCQSWNVGTPPKDLSAMEQSQTNWQRQSRIQSNQEIICCWQFQCSKAMPIPHPPKKLWDLSISTYWGYNPNFPLRQFVGVIKVLRTGRGPTFYSGFRHYLGKSPSQGAPIFQFSL